MDNEFGPILTSSGKKRGRKPGLNSSFIQRNAANARERSRMRVLSTAFVELKAVLPWVPKDTKLSKLDTLKLAAGYIAYLKQVLDSPSGANGTSGLTDNPFSEEFLLGNLLRESISKASHSPQEHSFSGTSIMDEDESPSQRIPLTSRDQSSVLNEFIPEVYLESYLPQKLQKITSPPAFSQSMDNSSALFYRSRWEGCSEHPINYPISSPASSWIPPESPQFPQFFGPSPLSRQTPQCTTVTNTTTTNDYRSLSTSFEKESSCLHLSSSSSASIATEFNNVLSTEDHDQLHFPNTHFT